MTARSNLRVRRYVDDRLVDSTDLAATDARNLAGTDAVWAVEIATTGRRARVVVDDPARDLEFALVLETDADGVTVGRLVRTVGDDGVEVAR